MVANTLFSSPLARTPHLPTPVYPLLSCVVLLLTMNGIDPFRPP